MSYTILFSTISNLLFAGSLLFLFSCSNQQPPENYLARVESNFLTAEDLRFLSMLNPDGKVPQGQLQSFLNDWVETEILAQEALKFDIEQDPYLQNRLRSFERKLLADAYIRYHIYKSIDISEQAVKNYYEDHKQVFMWEHDGAEVTQYVTPNSDSADAVYLILRNGTPEEKQLLYLKNHPNTRVVTNQEVISELGDAIFGTRATGVLRPVKSAFGYHVVIVKQRFKAGTYQNLNQVRDEIRERLLITEQKHHYYQVLDSLKGVIDFDINKTKYQKLSTTDKKDSFE